MHVDNSIGTQLTLQDVCSSSSGSLNRLPARSVTRAVLAVSSVSRHGYLMPLEPNMEALP